MSNKSTLASLYNTFVTQRPAITKRLLFFILLVSLIVGFNLRSLELKNNFGVNGGFHQFVEMASHFWTQPGGYNFLAGLDIQKDPENYVFTRSPSVRATGSIESEKGWAFLLSLIFTEGTRGLRQLENTAVKYQLIADLIVLITLFWVGKALGGPLGGTLTAILYATFRPAMSHMAWVSYYYWAYLFSATSLLFWTVVYRPEIRPTTLKNQAINFFLYGCWIGLATFFRLIFLYLPLVMIPIIFFRERSYKRAGILTLAMLLGQSFLLIPQASITKKYFGEFSLSTRGKWHFALQGLGAYANPWGLKDSGEVSLNKWVIDRGGPDLGGAGQKEWDNFIKPELFSFIRDRPDIFWKNFKANFSAGIQSKDIGGVRFSSGGLPYWKGISGDYSTYQRQFLGWFPWIALTLACILYFIAHQRAGPFLSVIFQGLYFVGSLCVFFPPVDVHMAGYYCIFSLTIALILAFTLRGLLALPEGLLRCWVWNRNWKQLPLTIIECFNEDWDKLPAEKPVYLLPKQKIKMTVMVGTLISVFILLLIQWDSAMEKKWKYEITLPSNAKEVKARNNILNNKNYGGFENWVEAKEPTPTGWSWVKGGPDAHIRRTNESSEVNNGTYGVEISTGSFGGSQIQFLLTPDITYQLIEKDMTLEAWVKSNTKQPKPLNIAILGPAYPEFPYQSFYKNSGQWERIQVKFKVPDILLSSMTIRIQATAPNSKFLIDDVLLKYTP